MEGRLSSAAEDNSNLLLNKINGSEDIIGRHAFEPFCTEKEEEGREEEIRKFLADGVASLIDGSVLVFAYDSESKKPIVYRRKISHEEKEENQTRDDSEKQLVTSNHNEVIMAQSSELDAFAASLGSRRVTVVASNSPLQGDRRLHGITKGDIPSDFSQVVFLGLNDGSFTALIVRRTTTNATMCFECKPAYSSPISMTSSSGGSSNGPITAATWASDGLTIAVALFSARVIVLPLSVFFSFHSLEFEGPSGQISEEALSPVASISGPTLPIKHLSFISTTRLVVSSLDGTLRVVDINGGGSTVAAVTLPSGMVTALKPLTVSGGTPCFLAGLKSGHVILCCLSTVPLDSIRASTNNRSGGGKGFQFGMKSFLNLGGIVSEAAANDPSAEVSSKKAIAFETSSSIPTAHFEVSSNSCSTLHAFELHAKSKPESEGNSDSVAVQDLFLHPAEKHTSDQEQGSSSKFSLVDVYVSFCDGSVERFSIEDDFNKPTMVSSVNDLTRIIRQPSNEGTTTACGVSWIPERFACQSDVDIQFRNEAFASNTSTASPVFVQGGDSIEVQQNAIRLVEDRTRIKDMSKEVAELTDLCAQLLDQVKAKQAAAEAAKAASNSKSKDKATKKGSAGKTAQPQKRGRN